jgi:hypothetical protein
MAGNKQWDRLAKIIKNAEQGLEGGIKSLQQNIKALTAGGTIGPPKPKKELIRALSRLRKALNKAILALERRIGGTSSRRKRPSRRKAAA